MSPEMLTLPTPQTGDSSTAGLLQRIANYPHLPTPPAVALEVIQMASQPDCELEEIGRIIQLDPGLCVQVLRAVNSAMFGLQKPIISIERALGFLGLRSVRSLVLSLSLPTMRLQTSSDPRLRDTWRASVAGAIVARELALRLGRPDPEDDMVAALLSDLGVFVLQQIFPVEYGPIIALSPEALADRQCDLEKEIFGVTHADVSALVLGRWRLPEEITEPIRHHHTPKTDKTASKHLAERSGLLWVAARAAQLQITPKRQPALVRELMGQVCDELRLSESAFLEFLEPLNRKIDEFTAILQIDIGALTSFQTVVANATVELIQLTMEAHPDMDPVEATQEVTEAEMARWRRMAQKLRREATRDRLTGVYNRAFFEEVLAQEFRNARRHCTVLGLIIIDLDNTRYFNGTYGLPTGDQILKEVASTLKRETRTEDIVSRLAGDEFSVILPNTSPSELESTARRLLLAIQACWVKTEGGSVTFSVSMGAVSVLPYHRRNSCPDFLARARLALGTVKTTGKNNVSLVSLVTNEETTFLADVERRLFSTYLLERELVTLEQLRTARRTSPPAAILVGRLARRLGWLSPRRLRRLLREQHKRRSPFGEAALSLKYLRPTQVFTLLAIQREPPESLADGLIDAGALEHQEALEHIGRYYVWVKGMA